MSRSPLDAASIISRLDEYLEVEFTFIRTESFTAVLAGMPRDRQDFILEWTRRAAATNTELAFQFANRAKEALREVEPDVVSAWCLHAMDSYDKAGLQSAMSVIRDLDGFLAVGHQRAAGSVFEEAVPILMPFVQGLEGRRLKIEPGEFAWTDGEMHLSARDRCPAGQPGRQFSAVQIHRHPSLGTDPLWHPERQPAGFFWPVPAPGSGQSGVHALETMRLDGRIGTELPGLYRRMCGLSAELGDPPLAGAWEVAAHDLGRPGAQVEDSLAWVEQLYAAGPVPQRCYQGQLNPEAAWAARLQRIERDKARLRESLRVVAEEIAQGRGDQAPPEQFGVEQPETGRRDRAVVAGRGDLGGPAVADSGLDARAADLHPARPG